MSFIKEYFGRNKAYFVTAFLIWFVALCFGIYRALRADGESFLQINYYTEAAINGGTGFKSLLLSSLKINFKFTLAILVSSSFVITLPVTLVLTGFKGMAAGFTAASVIRVYGFKGTLISLLTIVLPYSASLPVFFIMFTVSLRYQIHTLKNRKITDTSQRKKEWVSYAAAMLVLFLILCSLSFVEAFFVPKLIKLIN